MKHFISKSQKGFTLIELLIVIALLGALAVGLIGAIDPFEQLKKGTDTATRNNVSEIHGAAIRYFALKGWLPYCTNADCTGDTLPSGTFLNATPMSDVAIPAMVASGELKSNFTTVAANDLGKITVTGDESSIAVCYRPTAKSFQADVNTKYDADGAEHSPASECKSAGGTTDCYWCVQ